MPKGELSTNDLVQDALREGKEVFVPYIQGMNARDSVKRRSTMEMVSLHSLSDYQSLQPDTWGIPSVSEDSVDDRRQILGAHSASVSRVAEEIASDTLMNNRLASWKVEDLDMIVMPGVAFDRGLSRLGHGKGFYDYFLELYHNSKAAPMPFLGT